MQVCLQIPAPGGLHGEKGARLLHRQKDGGPQQPGPQGLCWNGDMRDLGRVNLYLQ